MSYDEFKFVLKREKAFNKYMHGFFATCLIVFMLFLFIDQYGIQNIVMISFEILMLLLGIYALHASIVLDKFTEISNNFSLEENSEKLKSFVYKISNQKIDANYTKFTYFKNNIWRTPYQVYIYAGNNFVAINARIDYSGIVDLGASARMEKRLIRLISEVDH